MPPRTTRKSYRPRASDRTMVGTAQPICLSAPGTDRRRHDSIMNLWNWSDHSVSLQYGGWTARPFSRCFTVAGEVFVLTSLFIERDYRNVGFGKSQFQETRLFGTWCTRAESQVRVSSRRPKDSARDNQAYETAQGPTDSA